MQIVPMQRSHIPVLAILEESCFAHPWTAQGLAEELDNPQAHFLTAVENAQVCGYIGVHEICGEAYIANIAVFPAFRRHGVGRALLETAEIGARARGCVLMTLEVRPSNTGAAALYTGRGFRFVGVRPHFYRDPDEDAHIYTKSFEESAV